MLEKCKFWDELAVESYKVILKSKPNNALVHKNLGLAYLRLKKENKAIRSFQRAIKNNKKHAETYYHLGSAYQRVGKRTEAIRAFANYNKLMKLKKEQRPVVDALIQKLKMEE